MADQPFALVRRTVQPRLAQRKHPLGVVFGDVAQVVGHTAAHVQRWVVLQPLQNGQHRAGVLHKSSQAHAPGQPGAAAFRAQAAHMRVGVGCPFQQPGQRSGLVAHQKRPDGKLRAEAPGERMLRPHGHLEGIIPAVVRGIQPVAGHKTGVRQVEKHAQPEVFGAGQWRRERGQQNVGGLGKGAGQVGVQGLCQLVPPLHQPQRSQAVEGCAAERLRVKTATCAVAFRTQRAARTVHGLLDVVGQALHRQRPQQIGQRTALLDRPGCVGNAQCADGVVAHGGLPCSQGRVESRHCRPCPGPPPPTCIRTGTLILTRQVF